MGRGKGFLYARKILRIPSILLWIKESATLWSLNLFFEIVFFYYFKNKNYF